MVDLLIAGTLALDSIKTPFGEAKNSLGGSAMYASLASSFFAKPAICSIIGEDFPKEHMLMLKEKGINVEAVATTGKTFRWSGAYEYDMNEAKTLNTELNALLEFQPKIPESLRKTKYLFLGNLDPEIQISIIEQMDGPEKIMMDTMNFWIETKKEELKNVIGKSDIFVINEGEARMLFETPNLIKAGKNALKLGPETVIIKKGEHGSLLFTNDDFFAASGYPLETVQDPTGCGDCFGGGLLGYLATHRDATLRKAIINGSIIASYNAEGMASERLQRLTKEEIDKRYIQYKRLIEF